tara:strand:- start:525 stop:1196 length:672 start_codon:yes stop_codon:yes gene_type:complete
MELNTNQSSKRWRELAGWEPGADLETVQGLVEVYLPSACPLALWLRQGRRKLAELRFDYGAQEEPLEVEQEPAPEAVAPVAVAPVAPLRFAGGDEVQRAVELYRDQIANLRADLAAERARFADLVAEALTTGRGSQASLVKLIGVQGNLLADAWKNQAAAVGREMRSLNKMQEETITAEEQASIVLAEAAEAQAQQEQGGQVLAAILDHLGPEFISGLMKGGK